MLDWKLLNHYYTHARDLALARAFPDEYKIETKSAEFAKRSAAVASPQLRRTHTASLSEDLPRKNDTILKTNMFSHLLQPWSSWSFEHDQQ